MYRQAAILLAGFLLGMLWTFMVTSERYKRILDKLDASANVSDRVLDRLDAIEEGLDTMARPKHRGTKT